MSLTDKIKQILIKKRIIPTQNQSEEISVVQPTAIQEKVKHTKSALYRNKGSAQRQNRPSPKNKTAPEIIKPTIIPTEKKLRFTELGLDPKIIEVLTKNNFIETTEVQAQSIPVSLKGRNVFCSSQTGSGKTLAFLLPMFQKLMTKEISQALIVCPTREIAIQTQKVMQIFLNLGDFKSGLVVGGTDMHEQKRILHRYPEILVATPGRLLDMVNTGLIWLKYTGYVVLDEADRMLDMGFEKDLILILKELTGEHQTMLFSATLFPEILKLANHYVKDCYQIKIGSPSSIASSVTHYLIDVDSGEKLPALIDLIFKNKGKIIVFFNTINEADKIYRSLKRVNIRRIDCLHSRRDQQTREHIIREFRSGEINILLASDVAARGIDIPNVELVINYDLPKHSEEYIHRVGRTGRAGLQGKSVSLYTYKDKKILADIEKLIESKIRHHKIK
ncbi:MAG: hypothetical protein A2Y40_06210 [Candidatus Margulisbacteria bacterium GWF2_35_9]|nr:MAG: hypothetical protein A2Y40_06210 [Candidatus Margulisbacteria bacterium GWF2_35_9]